ncbi:MULTISPECIES: pentapeptide repeat-containing protein [Nostoc]|uniref:Pentapeptide repeat-containing protein n=2 Tax=Nostoc TaxID=1177 RepID=A0ABR8IHN1_9NOSO|nr:MULTISPECIES: pentapeptide repeat-containing protein [Nostoc]MBD2563276.1 pentapeptide repeat-containing protein [Nostoc linckia FACHB-391]MBD2650481.1 pentapeptide repeat-containing protein [Nostoc foliaceum FACHB-393]
MKNIISIVWNSWLKRHEESILLFDSIAAASEIALMLNGQWDGCNGVIIAKCDEIAVNTATKLLEAAWCYQGASKAVLNRVTTDDALRRYAMGERNFINANFRCAILASAKLSEINLSYAKLSWADLSQANLSKADLTAADLSEANLSGADLSKAYLMRANLTKANLQLANLSGANLSSANLSEVNLTDADLTGVNLSLADLRGANFHFCNLSGANLTGAKLIESDLAFARK